MRVSRGVAEAVLRGGPVPQAPAGLPPGGRFLVTFGDEPVAVAEVQGGGRSAVVWRSNQADG
jgi:hypothetical protein